MEKEKSAARRQLENMLKYMPTMIEHNGQWVKLTVENYEEITGKKLPE